MKPIEQLERKYPGFSLAGEGSGVGESQKKIFEPEQKEKEKEVVGVSIPVLLQELATLLRENPAWIISKHDHFGIGGDPEWLWANRNKVTEISLLVFGPLFDYLGKHPAEKITAKNLHLSQEDGKDGDSAGNQANG